MALSETENGCSGGEGGESDAIVKAAVLGGFSESGETRDLISSLPEVHGDTVTSESATQRFLGETVIDRVHESSKKPFLISALVVLACHANFLPQ